MKPLAKGEKPRYKPARTPPPKRCAFLYLEI
jgi:hypothetical protein